MAEKGYRSYKGRGVVLHGVKYGDSALVVHLLTDVGGRQSFMVQGVGRGKGSKLALFQPMSAVEFEGLESSRTDLHRFKEVRRGMPLPPFDVRRSTIALFMAEVLYRLVKESEPNEALFEFVWGSTEALNEMGEGVANFHLWFLVHLSRLLGYFPGNAYRDGSWFDAREGLYTPVRTRHTTVLTPAQARLLHDFVECDVRCLAEVPLHRSERVAFLEALLSYYGYHLDAIQAVQSVRVLKEVF